MPTFVSSDAPRRAAAPLLALLLWACSNSSIGLKLDVGGDCAGVDDACQTGMCYSVDTGTSLCTLACVANAECPVDWFCEKTPDRDKLCLPSGLGGRCGDDQDCPAGHWCDADTHRCYIRVQRDLCAPCTSPKQCPEGGTCASAASGEMFCTRPCETTACPEGYTCESVPGTAGKQCLPARLTCNAGKPLCSPCRGDAECGGQADLCVRNLQSSETFCATACDTAAPCPSGFNCLGLGGDGKGPFQCVPNSGSCADYCDSNDPESVRRMCGLGRSCDVAARRCIAGLPGTLCAPCENDDDCPDTANSTRCVVNNCSACPFKGEKFCAPSCTGAGGQKDETKCLVGFVCTGLGTGGTSGPWQCVPRTGTCRAGAGQLGDDCGGRGGLACLSGVCLGFGSQSLCSLPCSADADCHDARFRCCAAVKTGDKESFDCNQAPGAGGGVCAPRGGGFGADCSPGRPPCNEGVCLDMGTAHLCTRACSDTSPCSDGFSCQQARQMKTDGTWEDVSVCFPDGGGELGADCAFGPAACQSRLCIKKSSGNLCTIECNETTICADGWDCRAGETVDQQSVQVCVPSSL